MFGLGLAGLGGWAGGLVAGLAGLGFWARAGAGAGVLTSFSEVGFCDWGLI